MYLCMYVRVCAYYYYWEILKSLHIMQICKFLASVLFFLASWLATMIYGLCYSYAKIKMTTIVVLNIIHIYTLFTCLGDASNFGGELYGTGSRCFQQGGPWSLKTGTRTLTAGDYGSGCYRVSPWYLLCRIPSIHTCRCVHMPTKRKLYFWLFPFAVFLYSIWFES